MRDAAGPLEKVVKAGPRPTPEGEKPEPITYRNKRLTEDDDVPAANALVVMRRLAFVEAVHTENNRKQIEPDKKTTGPQTREWAVGTQLGQKPASGLLAALHQRRNTFLRRATHTAAYSDGSPHKHLPLTITTELRIAVGLGLSYGPHESGLALHGTYGFPILPGSALDGLAAAAAREDETASIADIRRIFGSPRPGEEPDEDNPSCMGSVTFLDALPVTSAKVYDDVITPHQKPYYSSSPGFSEGRASTRIVPPAEHYQPEPASFLSISGTFRVDLLGRDVADLDKAERWLSEAGDTFGIGGRTTAGYGYFRCERSAMDPT